MTRLEDLIARITTATPAEVDELVREVESLRYDLTPTDQGAIRHAIRNLTIADARRILAAL